MHGAMCAQRVCSIAKARAARRLKGLPICRHVRVTLRNVERRMVLWRVLGGGWGLEDLYWRCEACEMGRQQRCQGRDRQCCVLGADIPSHVLLVTQRLISLSRAMPVL